MESSDKFSKLQSYIKGDEDKSSILPDITGKSRVYGSTKGSIERFSKDSKQGSL
jgi:hypothetical protein